MWNLDPAKGGIGAGEVAEGARLGRNDFGTIGYRGPCPPHGHGTHHYHFVLLALSQHVALADGATIVELHRAASAATLATTTVRSASPPTARLSPCSTPVP